MNEMGKFLVIAGLLLAVVGALLWLGVGKSWLGRLPGACGAGWPVVM